MCSPACVTRRFGAQQPCLFLTGVPTEGVGQTLGNCTSALEASRSLADAAPWHHVQAPKCRSVGTWEGVHPELPRLTLWCERELSIKASNTSLSGPFCVKAKVRKLSSMQASPIPVALYSSPHLQSDIRVGKKGSPAFTLAPLSSPILHVPSRTFFPAFPTQRLQIPPFNPSLLQGKEKEAPGAK